MNRTTTLLLILSSVLATGSTLVTGAAGAEPQESSLERLGLRFDAAVVARYDDNIIQLSDEDIARLEQGPPSSRFRITTPDDWVGIARFDGRWRHSIFSRRETRLHAGADVYRYHTNGIKDWEEYKLDWDQELTASRKHLVSLRVTGELVSDFYLRELTDDDASFAAGRRIRNSARYDQTSLSATLEREMIENRLTVELDWKRADRDYVPDFDERDGLRTDWRVEARVRPVGHSRLRFDLQLSTGDYAARGDLASTPVPDDDISYDFDGAKLRAALPWGERSRGRVEVDLEYERRDFTTTNQFDLFRYGRVDDRWEYALKVAQFLGHGLDLSAEWRRRSNDATFPPTVVPQDDVTDYDENRFELGLRARFGS